MSATMADTRHPSIEQGGISCDPDVVGGTPVFVGTRVPAATLFDYLMRGRSLSEFRDDFPTVTEEHVLGVLRSARDYVSRSNFPPRNGMSSAG